MKFGLRLGTRALAEPGRLRRRHANVKVKPLVELLPRPLRYVLSLAFVNGEVA